MANFLSEPKVLPLGVCIGRLSQPRLDSKFCAELSRPCFGVSVELGGMRTSPWLFCTTVTAPVDAGAGGCVEATCLSVAACLSLAGRVTAM